MELIWLLILGTSIWVAVDVQQYRNRYSRPEIKGPSMSLGTPGPYDAGSGSGAWLLACLLLWIVAFPLYLVRRSRPPGAVPIQHAQVAGHTPPRIQADSAWQGAEAQTSPTQGTSRPSGGKFCSECGTRLVGGAKFCNECGTATVPG